MLPDPLPARLLFISAGSGITPIMSMLRSLAAARAIARRRARAQRAHRRRRDLRATSCASSARATPATASRAASPARRAASPRQQLDELCPDWRERETFLCGPAGLLEAMSAHWKQRRRPGAPARRALPARRARRRRRARRGRHDQLLPSGVERQQRRLAADPARRRGRRRDAALRLPHGHLPHAASGGCAPGRCATCAPAGCTASPARCCAPASTRPRAPIEIEL